MLSDKIHVDGQRGYKVADKERKGHFPILMQTLFMDKKI